MAPMKPTDEKLIPDISIERMVRALEIEMPPTTSPPHGSHGPPFPAPPQSPNLEITTVSATIFGERPVRTWEKEMAAASEPTDKPPLPPKASFVEQTKLTATFFNQMGAAVFAVGGAGPVIATFATSNPFTLRAAAVSLVCTATAFALHLLGRRFLRRLDR